MDGVRRNRKRAGTASRAGPFPFAGTAALPIAVARAPANGLLPVSPLDKPNAVLILGSDSRVRLAHLGRERTGLACIFPCLGRPDALQHALLHARGMDA